MEIKPSNFELQVLGPWEATTAIKYLAEALFHNLWQGAVIAGLLLLVLRGVLARSSRLRYWVSVIALLILVFSLPVQVWVLSVILLRYSVSIPSSIRQIQGFIHTVNIFAISCVTWWGCVGMSLEE